MYKTTYILLTFTVKENNYNLNVKQIYFITKQNISVKTNNNLIFKQL